MTSSVQSESLREAPDLPVISLITPAFNESANLPVLYQQLVKVLDPQMSSWEWIVVDDHSTDSTFDVVRAMSAADSRVRGIRLARNSGSHVAVALGLERCLGNCAVVLAADLQDPPETVLPLVEKWRAGAHVVWAVRAAREGETKSTILFARCYYWIMRRVVGLRQMPPTGADFFLLDRRVLAALQEFGESNISMLALITWMGFRQDHIEYVKHARLHGSSGWSFAKKIKLVVDSVTAFSYLPIRVMSCAGFCVALAGFLYAGLVVFNAFSGRPIEGWSSLMVVLLIVGGFQLLFMGTLGEYLWRTLDEARRRPRFLIEDATPNYAQQCAVQGVGRVDGRTRRGADSASPPGAPSGNC